MIILTLVLSIASLRSVLFLLAGGVLHISYRVCFVEYVGQTVSSVAKAEEHRVEPVDALRYASHRNFGRR